MRTIPFWNKIFVIFILVSMYGDRINAQDLPDSIRIKRNVFLLELGGPGIFSGSYGRMFNLGDKSPIDMTFDIGITYVGYSGVYTFPVEYDMLFRKLKDHLEIGLGYAPSFGKRATVVNNITYTSSFDYLIFGVIGYRFVASNGVIL